jgi:diphthamide synthase (EF-2-diphthine--ammonia ligase)
VNLTSGRAEWLGRELTDELAAELRQTPGVDPCGERGEYHSFAFAGPLFARPVQFEPAADFESEGHRIRDLRLAG